MEIGKSSHTQKSKIGELLVAAGVIDRNHLYESLQLAKRTNSKIGRSLCMTGCVQERDISSALNAQKMVRDGVITHDYACRVLEVACRARISFEEALSKQGFNSEKSHNFSELAELFLGAEIVSSANLNAAIRDSEQSGLPLGRSLINLGFVSPLVMSYALNVQVLVRDQVITREQAVEGLRQAVMKRVSLEQALQAMDAYNPPRDNVIRLGELFGIAGLLSESDALDAVELSLENKKLVGEVLLEQALVSLHNLDNALKLQLLISEGMIETNQAVVMLREADCKHETVDSLLRDMYRFSSKVLHLLKIGGFISEEDIRRSLVVNTKKCVDLVRSLFDASIIDGHMLQAARCCQERVDSLKMSVEQAVTLLHYVERTRCTVDQALDDLGLKTLDASDNYLEPKVFVDDDNDSAYLQRSA